MWGHSCGILPAHIKFISCKEGVLTPAAVTWDLTWGSADDEGRELFLCLSSKKEVPYLRSFWAHFFPQGIWVIKRNKRRTRILLTPGYFFLGVGTSNLVIYGKGCATENSCGLDKTIFGSIQVKTSCSSPVSNRGHPTAKFVSAFLILLLPLKFLLWSSLNWQSHTPMHMDPLACLDG